MSQQSLAFVFPGQGSQAVGMLSAAGEQFIEVKAAFGEASEVLDKDLWEICQSGPDSLLNQTEITQPAILTASVGLWRAWQARSGLPPFAMAGHSLGEYSALVAAGVLEFVDAVRIVHLRGKFMQAAVAPGEGAMAAVIGLADEVIESVCEDVAEGEVVSPVNYNAPGQLVIAGSRDAVDRAIAGCKAAGARRALPLPVSVPSHCALMKPAAERLGDELNAVAFQAPRIDVFQNVTAAATRDPEEIKANLVAQLHSPVLWTRTVENLSAAGAAVLLECGPGKVLSGLNRRINRKLQVGALADPADLEQQLSQFGLEG